MGKSLLEQSEMAEQDPAVAAESVKAPTPAPTPQPRFSYCRRSTVQYRGKEALAATKVTVARLDYTERFFSVVNCGGVEWMFSRKENKWSRSSDLFPWVTVLRECVSPGTVRLAGCQEYSQAFEPPILGFAAHNLAGYCVGNVSLVVLGGRDETGRKGGRKEWESGIIRISARITSKSNTSNLIWQVSLDNTRLRDDDEHLPLPEVTINGDKGRTHCIDRRPGFERCEYDGRLSLVRMRDRVLLYSRANMFGEQGDSLPGVYGGRHVQVAFSRGNANPRTWSYFRPVAVANHSVAPWSNIYFMSVEPFFDERRQRRRLAALFPASMASRRPHQAQQQRTLEGGIYVSVSDDGIHFSPPERLLRSSVLKEGRTADYPISHRPFGRGVRRGTAVLVQHNIRIPGNDMSDPLVQKNSRGGLGPPRRVKPLTYFCRYFLPGSWEGEVPSTGASSPKRGRGHQPGPGGALSLVGRTNAKRVVGGVRRPGPA
eukprot:CAMPEP_0172628872 /NCGR_PEP_ID=MMETSP1068-20121228/164337_1 /TAXON_ID=35684 /ORGANISM="Pseudopedinella elastica, Strain CCMP716" /LENGTH=485 /DNA_ID=CAMNT_0013439235 /DNA_START=246 /DNA_END=1703 /DNA_ORIENTATION=-